MKWKVLIADDEAPARDLLHDYVSQLTQLELVSVCANGLEVLTYLQQDHADILFLDIQMPRMKGTDILKTATGKRPVVVFTTAYDQYAVEAFDLDAADYLLKPFSFERFTNGVNRAIRALQANAVKSSQDNRPFIMVKSEYKLIKLPLDQIICIEGFRDYIQIHSSGKTNQRVLTLDTMKNMEAALPPEKFIRIHKSYIVQVDSITSFQGNQVEVMDKLLPVGRMYKKILQERLGR